MAKIALLIGVSQYTEDLKPLLSAEKDVEAMRRVLTNQEIGEFDQVATLLNPDPTEMRVQIENLFSDNRKRDDLILLFYLLI